MQYLRRLSIPARRVRWCTIVGMLVAVGIVLSPILRAQGVLEDPTRPVQDLERDPESRPLEVFGFWGIAPGQIVVELFPFGGYNTHLLSRIVGPGGKVVAARTEFGRDALLERIDSAELENVATVESLAAIEAGSVDVIVSVRNLHDLYVFLEDEPTVIYEHFRRILKSDGVLGVVDARTSAAPYDDATHRINEAFLITELASAGFRLEASSDLLANPDDDETAAGFPARTSVDRMLLKFVLASEVPVPGPAPVALDTATDEPESSARKRPVAASPGADDDR